MLGFHSLKGLVRQIWTTVISRSSTCVSHILLRMKTVGLHHHAKGKLGGKDLRFWNHVDVGSHPNIPLIIELYNLEQVSSHRTCHRHIRWEVSAGPLFSLPSPTKSAINPIRTLSHNVLKNCPSSPETTSPTLFSFSALYPETATPQTNPLCSSNRSCWRCLSQPVGSHLPPG